MPENLYDNHEFNEKYAQMERSVIGLEAAGEWPQLKELLGDMKDKDFIDLGCGYGWHCAYAVTAGAKSVVGIDQSEKMLSKAMEINAHPLIQYRNERIETFIPDFECCDLVLSNLVLHYIRELTVVYRNVYAALRKNGIFVFNIEHPVFTSGIRQEFVQDANGNNLYWPIDDYFISGPRDTVFLGEHVEKQHHTLTEVLQGLLDTGFAIEAVQEVRPTDEVIESNGWQDELRRPMMLLVKARKV